MCGRYGLYNVDDSNILKENTGYDFKANYNVAPTHKMPVIVKENDKQKVEVMQWGITRQIGKDVEKSIFNTRSDKASSRFWGKTVRSTRCLVPANGFFEWRKGESGKIPFWIYEEDSPLIYFAGIYSIDSDYNPYYFIMTNCALLEAGNDSHLIPVELLTTGKLFNSTQSSKS